jgi:hypothetical protein
VLYRLINDRVWKNDEAHLNFIRVMLGDLAPDCKDPSEPAGELTFSPLTSMTINQPNDLPFSEGAMSTIIDCQAACRHLKYASYYL